MDKKHKLSYKRSASFVNVFEDDYTKKLPIPLPFTKNFGEHIPPWLILEIAGTRKCWRVDIEEDGNGGLYLSCGFDCFVKAHSLEDGNFLLFELEEPSILQVRIYEKDGSERAVETTFEPAYEVGAFESPRKTPITCIEEEASPWPTTMPSFQYGEYEKQQSTSGGIQRKKCIVGAFESPRQTPIMHQEEEASPWPTSMPSVQCGDYEKQQNITGGVKRKKCIVSPTEHGLCFSLTWRNATHFIYYMTIPKQMLRGKALSNKDELVIQNQEGNSWPVELRFRQDGRVDFAQGWKKFVTDNELRTGDTLTFEFVSNNVIQVHVERAFQVDNPLQREQECKIEPTERIHMACENEEFAANCTSDNNAPVAVDKSERISFESKRCSFSTTWTYKTKNSYLHIPKTVANQQNLKDREIVVLCDPEGKKWLMEVRTRPSDGRVGLGRGWADFTKSYGIDVGDTLYFEFETDRTMKVKIIKPCSGLDVLKLH